MKNGLVVAAQYGCLGKVPVSFPYAAEKKQNVTEFQEILRKQ